MSYSFHEDAEKVFNTATQYYEECQAGLGLRFSHEILDAIKRVCECPDAWSIIDSKTRRCLTNRFPFGVLYRVVDNQIRIMAIMHLHRKKSFGLLKKYWARNHR